MNLTGWMDSFDATFPVSEKMSARKKKELPIFKWLRKSLGQEVEEYDKPERDERDGPYVRKQMEVDAFRHIDSGWNFEKFLIDSKGNIVKHCLPSIPPDGCEKELDKMLA